MARPDLAAAARLPAYGRLATSYDSRTAAYTRYRRMAVAGLPLRSGDVVLDVGCGTGLCFPLLQERIGPDGTVVGVDAAPDMLALAAARATAAGWTNMVLLGDYAETADLPEVDHALFCAVHDILQSGPALDHVVAHVRPGGWVCAVGGKWGPPFAVAANAAVLALHAPYVRDFAGFEPALGGPAGARARARRRRGGDGLRVRGARPPSAALSVLAGRSTQRERRGP